MSTINTPERTTTNLFSIYSHHGQPQTSFQTASEKTGCRSVKSIVAWLEASSSNQSWSPRSNRVDLTHDLSTGSMSTYPEPQHHNHSVSIASDVEDYSLTYLKYKNYFTSVPLVRCLDQANQPAGDGTGTTVVITQSSSPRRSVETKHVTERIQQKLEDETDENERNSMEAEFPFIQRDRVEVIAF